MLLKRRRKYNDIKKTKKDKKNRKKNSKKKDIFNSYNYNYMN